MDLLSKIKPGFSASAAPGARARRAGMAAPLGDDTQRVSQARTRARRRLIGAALLLALGVVGFALLFETQPRPLPAEVSIQMPAAADATPVAQPAAPQRAANTHAAVPVDEAPAAAKPPAASVAAAQDAPPVSAAAPTQPAKPTPQPAAGAAKVAKLKKPPAAPGKPAARAAASTSAATQANAGAVHERTAAEQAAVDALPPTGRFVVQVGAFTDVVRARQARQKLQAQGIKTYTQVVETPQGRHIRVRGGPYSTKAAAEKAAARARAAGLSAAVLLL